ncbi:hypothetical protein EVA_19614 [gut metagenome]|uniref:Uncharacterized protein n=1 Tax=gut metagenome TaxID=749906 RepID=J9FBK0_9ZZZZ
MKITSEIATQVENDMLEIIAVEFGKGSEKFRIGGITKTSDTDIARGIIHHIRRINRLNRYITTDNGVRKFLILPWTDNTQLNCRTSSSLEALLRGIVIYNLVTHIQLTINAHDTVTRLQSRSFGRTAWNHVDHAYRIPIRKELDTYT